jgi:hypothetical protein
MSYDAQKKRKERPQDNASMNANEDRFRGYIGNRNDTAQQTVMNNVRPSGYGGGTTTTPYMQQLNNLYDQIVNRKPFQYDLNGDLLYRQMADQYTQLGRHASADAMGQAAALTGGYGNSYATQVGNQANQQYLTALNANIPELYDRALQAYLAEGDRLMQQYELTAAHPAYLQAMQPSSGGGGTAAKREPGGMSLEQAAFFDRKLGNANANPADGGINISYEQLLANALADVNGNPTSADPAMLVQTVPVRPSYTNPYDPGVNYRKIKNPYK